MNLKWVDDNRQYSTGKVLYLGKWPVGGVHWDSMSGKDQLNKYKATSKLPGIKPDNGNFKTEEEAKAKAESVVKYWLSKIDE